MVDFSNKRVLLTGGSSGIGAAAARQLIEAGAQVAVVGRREAALSEVASGPAAGRGFPVVADLTVETDVEDCVSRAVGLMGGLDILINCAGIIEMGTLETTPLEAWDVMMNVNLRSVFHLMKTALPHLEKSRGNIVNVSSVAGLRSFPGVIAYCVSKAGMDQLTRCAALELAPKGIRVNSVNPGVVVTGLHRSGGMGAEAYSAFLEHSKSTHPLGRVGQAGEVAELILFLASDRAGWITGVTVSIDGGRAATCLR
jgi:NAD(P)-dependent dehydrogenase (short-subunit alcohol dehydrogenase family)